MQRTSPIQRNWDLKLEKRSKDQGMDANNSCPTYIFFISTGDKKSG